MAKESLQCPDDCPMQKICEEKLDTVDFALAGLEGMKEQTADITANASSAISLARELAPTHNVSGLKKVVNVNLIIADQAMDVTADQERLYAMLRTDLVLWKRVITQMRERCTGPRNAKRYKLFGKKTIRCALETAEVVNIIEAVRHQLIDDAAAEAFGSGVEDS